LDESGKLIEDSKHDILVLENDKFMDK